MTEDENKNDDPPLCFCDLYGILTFSVSLFLNACQCRCVYYGVLPFEEAERINKKVVKRKQRLRAGGGASSSSPALKKKKKVKVVREDGVDPDMQVSGGDGIGRAVL